MNDTFNYKAVWDAATRVFSLGEHSLHGPSHWRRVEANAITAAGAQQPLRLAIYDKTNKSKPIGPATSVPVEFLQVDAPSDNVNKVENVTLHAMHL